MVAILALGPAVGVDQATVLTPRSQQYQMTEVTHANGDGRGSLTPPLPYQTLHQSRYLNLKPMKSRFLKLQLQRRLLTLGIRHQKGLRQVGNQKIRCHPVRF